jgi:hypothetical protein
MVKELELPEDIAINYISSEGALVKELMALRKELHPQYIEQGISKMKAQEEIHLGWLKEKITDPLKMEKFTKFRKDFYDNFSNSLPAIQRKLATEAK